MFYIENEQIHSDFFANNEALKQKKKIKNLHFWLSFAKKSCKDRHNC